MKKPIALLSLIIMVSLFFACTDETEELEVIQLKEIEISATPSSTTIDLSWVPVEEVSWYNIYVGVKGENLESINNMQDLKNNPITYTIDGLSTNTEYEVKIEGTTYASGGEKLAEKTIFVTTAK